MTKLWLVIAAAIALAVGGTWLALHERTVGRQLQQALDAQAALHVARAAVAKAETVYVAKVDTFTRWQTRTVALHDTVLKHLTDTVLVKRYVATADSTIRACSDVVLSCDTVRARYRALVRADSVAAAAPKPKTGLFADIKARTGVYVGYGIQLDSAHVVRHGVQLGIGFKVWGPR